MAPCAYATDGIKSRHESANTAFTNPRIPSPPYSTTFSGLSVDSLNPYCGLVGSLLRTRGILRLRRMIGTLHTRSNVMRTMNGGHTATTTHGTWPFLTTASPSRAIDVRTRLPNLTIWI